MSYEDDDEGSEYFCLGCEEYENDVNICECGEPVCQDCSVFCDTCNYLVCINCREECHCYKTYCEGCYHECECHRDELESDEDEEVDRCS